MSRYQRATVAFIVALWAVFAALGPLWAMAGYAAAEESAAPAAIVLQVESTAVPADDPGGAGNPADEPGVIDNPVTENPLDINAQIAMWLAVLGFVSTFAISFVNRLLPGVSPEDATKRGVVAFLFCVAVGLIDTIVRGTLNLTNATAAILLVFSTAIGFYNLWFKGSQMARNIEGV